MFVQLKKNVSRKSKAHGTRLKQTKKWTRPTFEIFFYDTLNGCTIFKLTITRYCFFPYMCTDFHVHWRHCLRLDQYNWKKKRAVNLTFADISKRRNYYVISVTARQLFTRSKNGAILCPLASAWLLNCCCLRTFKFY